VAFADGGEWKTPHGNWLMALFDVHTSPAAAAPEAHGSTPAAASDDPAPQHIARYFIPLSIVYEDADESRMQ
jgi:hypothetical protein